MNKAKHLTKALHNIEFFNSLDIDKTKYLDWVVVGIFYAAIHYYEAYFADINRHSSSHDISDEWIANDKKIAVTYGDYRELKEFRWNASYWSRIFPPNEIKNNILPKLNNIIREISSIVNPTTIV